MSDNLLKIDVSSEIRKLTNRRFKSKGEYCLELIRYVAQKKPQFINIRVSQKSFSLQFDGAEITADVMDNLLTVFDTFQPDEQRHQALVAIEASEGLRLLSAFSLPKFKVIISNPDHNNLPSVFISEKHCDNIQSTNPNFVEIKVSGKKRRRDIEKKIIAESCKYAQFPVRLNGKPIQKGLILKNCLLVSNIKNHRLSGIIGVPKNSSLTRILRLVNGIKKEEIIRPPVNGLVFQAIIDEKDNDLKASWSTIRRATRRLFYKLTERFDKFNPEEKQQALYLLIERFRSTKEYSLINKVKAFKTADGHFMSLTQIESLKQTGQLYAIDPKRRLSQDNLDDMHILLLDTAGRKFLEEVLAIKLDPPPFVESLQYGIPKVIWHLFFNGSKNKNPFKGTRGIPVETEHLSQKEGNFLNAVSQEIRSGAFELPTERKPFLLQFEMTDNQTLPLVKTPSNNQKHHYSISRNHPDVEKMIHRYHQNKTYIYPALIWLTNGHDGYANARNVAQKVILDMGE